MKIFLASPMGFCAGVDRAINILNLVSDRYPQVYVYNYIVHNEYIIDYFTKKGVKFIFDISEVPDGSVVVFSAHGVSASIIEEARSRGLRYFDATCPLVSKIHLEISKASQSGKSCILIGHRTHPEVKGTIGHFQGENLYIVEDIEEAKSLEVADETNLFYLTQTTLSVRDTGKIISSLEERFPLLSGPNKKDICYATENRQNALIELLEHVDTVLIVGSNRSSNTMRLVELAEQSGKPTYLVLSPSDLSGFSLAGDIGITAGASSPSEVVEAIIGRLLEEYEIDSVETLSGLEENLKFALPADL